MSIHVPFFGILRCRMKVYGCHPTLILIFLPHLQYEKVHLEYSIYCQIIHWYVPVDMSQSYETSTTNA